MRNCGAASRHIQLYNHIVVFDAGRRAPHMVRLTDRLFDQIAARFRALAEPARLRILDALRDGEQTVGELAGQTGLSQANLSKHLQLLHGLGFVTRRKHGLFVYYALADRDVFQLCDIMCGRLELPSMTRQRQQKPTTRRRL